MSPGSGPDRKVDQVRRMLAGPHPRVPADLAVRAAEKGARLLRRRRTVHRLAMCLLALAVTAFAVWAAVEQPWAIPPAETTPPLEGW
ncbi:hypothetical protein [Streptomyces sp. BE147]|uniref:hypothetical protein n=1 Tax=unclassified Streptomyces TaxID=2593676 RepID=UPI002E7A3EDF|nr:hypothetical protein [Streptomyces sp. BE147]MEE1741828.1 hypothetical protein [Streptomyces sp. BE147]